ncbi:spore germination protein [Paenibacillus arenilitoris]|uniref:Spore germination protein n=1 Tax=Paenibacillus arenilitoris TaxID=2772299 RepID=A0A927H4N0_9BACL|nr:spore germination protein [Paenibacillus arenilitoris]MBD2867557.1 spore germination protein [Paenibacillus arenilitoris]
MTRGSGKEREHELIRDHEEDDELTLEEFQESLRGCNDVNSYSVPAGENRRVTAHLFYCDGMVDNQQFHLGLLPQLKRWSDESAPLSESDGEESERTVDLFMRIKNGPDNRHLYARLFAGSVVIAFSARPGFYEYDIADQPGRQPEESTMELSLKGPRDGFVEQLAINLALVRKRLRTPHLHVEYRKLGTESQTEIALLYMAGQAKPELVEETRRRLEAVRVPALHGAGELEDLLADHPYALFPQLDYIGRPDYVVQSLMNGRVAVIVDGTPAALIAPGNLTLLIKSPEDAHLPYYFVALERILRILGLILSLCLPGFWIALSSYNTDQLPFSLLATVTISRIGLPMSATMEMFLMLTLFEVFREAGVRLPRPVGQTVSVVGGLIVGDAAIRAGLSSPTMLVVAAVSAVATFTLVNQSLNGSVTIIRYGILLTSSLLGVFGFFVGVFAVIIYLSSMESFGRSYLEPLAPIKPRRLVTALLQKPWALRKGRRGRP